MSCKIIDRWTSNQFFNEMLKQDFNGKLGLLIEENFFLPIKEERAVYWDKKIKYYERSFDNRDEHPFLVISDFPIFKLRREHEVDYDLVEEYAKDVESIPPIFIRLSDYMIQVGETFPLIINGHHRVAAFEIVGKTVINVVTDMESWKNLC